VHSSRAIAAEQALVGHQLTLERMKTAADLVDNGIEIEPGFQIKADEKRHLTRAVAHQAVTQAADACTIARSRDKGV
jgi:hypothetical protein